VTIKIDPNLRVTSLASVHLRRMYWLLVSEIRPIYLINSRIACMQCDTFIYLR